MFCYVPSEAAATNRAGQPVMRWMPVVVAITSTAPVVRSALVGRFWTRAMATTAAADCHRQASAAPSNVRLPEVNRQTGLIAVVTLLPSSPYAIDLALDGQRRRTADWHWWLLLLGYEESIIRHFDAKKRRLIEYFRKPRNKRGKSYKRPSEKNSRRSSEEEAIVTSGCSQKTRVACSACGLFSVGSSSVCDEWTNLIYLSKISITPVRFSLFRLYGFYRAKRCVALVRKLM